MGAGKPRQSHGSSQGERDPAAEAEAESAQERGSSSRAATIYSGAGRSCAAVGRDGEAKRDWQPRWEQQSKNTDASADADTPPCSPASAGSFCGDVVMETVAQVASEVAHGLESQERRLGETAGFDTQGEQWEEGQKAPACSLAAPASPSENVVMATEGVSDVAMGELERQEQDQEDSPELGARSPADADADAESLLNDEAMETAQAGDEAMEERRRRSSARSCSDDSDTHDNAAAAIHQLPVGALLATKADGVADGTSSASDAATHPKLSLDATEHGKDIIQKQSMNALASPRTFEQVVSPRSLANGKRFLSGYLLRRVPMAAGLLKTWKRQFFRLRDHGVVCYKDDDSGSSAPLFEIVFTSYSVLQVDRSRGDPASASPKAKAKAMAGSDPYAYIPDDAPAAVTEAAMARKQTTGSLTFILKHVEIIAGQQQGKVGVPMFLRAENEQEFGDWIYCLKLKMAARKEALAAQTAADGVVADGTSVEVGKPPGISKASSKAKGGDEGAQAAAVKSSGSNSSEKKSSPKPSLLSNIKRSLSFGRSSSLLFGVSPGDPPEFTQFHQRYMLMQEIGEGSFSIVHKAVNRLTGRLCAVKCCKYSPALVDEVRIMRTLNHPNLIKVEGVFKHEDMHYVIMDYMRDGDLCDKLIKEQRVPEKSARKIIAQVLQGLEYLHANCILHRDIKPENILLHGDMIKIADFGLAKQLTDPDATVNRSCGTLEYAAPELISGVEYGLKSDVFSLGVVMYVLLFGAFPFTLESATALQGMEKFPRGADIRDMSCLSPDNYQWHMVSPEAQDAILRMLARDPRERISAAELLNHPWFDLLDERNVPRLARTRSNLARNSSTASLGGIKALLDQQASSRMGSQHSNAPTFRQGDTEEQGQEELQEQRWLMRERTSAGHEMTREFDCDQQGFRELLYRGLEVTKFGFKGTTSPHPSVLRLDFVNRCISWTGRSSVIGGLGGSSRSVGSTSGSGQTPSTGKKRTAHKSILLADVLEIRVGHETEAFQHALLKTKSGAVPPSAALCLSIVSARRTLDIAVKAPSQREFLECGLRELLAAIQPHTSKPLA